MLNSNLSNILVNQQIISYPTAWSNVSGASLTLEPGVYIVSAKSNISGAWNADVQMIVDNTDMATIYKGQINTYYSQIMSNLIYVSQSTTIKIMINASASTPSQIGTTLRAIKLA